MYVYICVIYVYNECMYMYYVCMCVCVCVCVHSDDTNFASTFRITNNSTAATYYCLTSVVINWHRGETSGTYGVTVNRKTDTWKRADIKWRKNMHVRK